MAKGDGILWLVIGAIAVLFFFPNLLSGLGGTGTTTTGGVTTVSGQCFDDAISFISDDVRKDLLATNPGLSYRLFVGSKGAATANIDKGNNADAATVTVPTNAPYLELGAWNSGTETLVYRQKIEGNTDCTDPLTVQPVLAYADQNVTVYVTDEDGSLNGDGAFAVAAGQDFFFTPTIQVSSDFYWGNPYVNSKNILVVQYNSTSTGFNDIKIPSLTTAPVPDIARNNATGWNRKAFFLPSIKPNDKFSFRVEADTQSSGNPTGTSADIYFELYDANIDMNADNNNLIEDVEDEDNNNLGGVDTLNRFKEDLS